MKTNFFLARHGETQWNELKKLQGQLDSPLTEHGLKQAQQLALSLSTDALSTHTINYIVSSPLPRAKITAKIIGQHLSLPAHSHAGLIERDFGLWQGQLFTDVQTKPHFSDIFYQVTDYAPPRGETGINAAQRLQQALVDIATHDSQNSQTNHDQINNVLVITHGDVLRCFLSQLNDTGFSDAFSLYKNCCVMPVEFNHATQTFSCLQAIAEPA